MKHPLAKYQAIFVAAWLAFWAAGRILPGSLGYLAYTARDVMFLLASGLTAWIGYRMCRKQEKILLFYMSGHIELMRSLRQPQEAASLGRYYRRAATIHQTGQILLMVGGMCFLVGLYYFIF